MADAFTVQIDTRQVNLKLGRVSNQTRAALRGTIIDLNQAMAALVRAKLSGGVLQRRSGRLYNSVQNQLIENTTSIYGRVFTSGVPYARIHEYGGTIHHPGSDKFQAWQGPSGWIYTHRTRPHDIPIPERSYMRSSLEEMRAEIVSRMTASVRAGAKAA